MENVPHYQIPSRYGGISKAYRCPVCDKNFLVPFQTRGGGRNTWVYKLRKKRKVIYLCSYHCFEAAKEEEEAK